MGGTWRFFLYGGLASLAAEMGTFPIDTIKTRLQIQGQPGDSKLTGLKYKGMIDAFIKISKEEGLPALYSGIAPAAWRQAIYGTLQFGTYYSLKRFVTDHEIFEKKSETGEESVAANVVCAVVAGAVSSALVNPTDVVKIRMQVQGKGDSNMFKIFHEIYHHEGFRGLWRGVGCTTQRAIVLSVADLPLYDACKIALMDHYGDSVTNHSISSFIASIAAAVASCPIDVIRTRLMNQKVAKNLATTNSSGSRLYKGGLDCVIQTIKYEGFMALYKGFIPTCLRFGPWNLIFFVTYEKLNKLF